MATKNFTVTYTDEKGSISNVIDEETIVHSLDTDVGYDIFVKSEKGNRKMRTEEDEEVSKRVLRKIDMRVLPIMWSSYSASFRCS